MNRVRFGLGHYPGGGEGGGSVHPPIYPANTEVFVHSGKLPNRVGPYHHSQPVKMPPVSVWAYRERRYQ